jgi:uncharacterized protein involved in exopolysaccharide biosynthesis
MTNENRHDSILVLPSVSESEQEGPIAEALWLLWNKRRLLTRVLAVSTLASLVIALLLPSHYKATTVLMPPDSQSGAGMLAALLNKGVPGLGMIGPDLLGLKSSDALFQSVLQSRTVEDRIINRFDLRRVYGDKLYETTREELQERTEITEDRKSGVLSITVDDRDPNRATAMANAYVEELGKVIAELDTSSAHRERVFLEERLKLVQRDLEAAENDFSQFSSKNMAIDIKEQAKAMVEAAATLQGQLIGAESELEGLRQIYADNNVRVRALEARISELKQQLEKVGGKGEDLKADSASSEDPLYPSIKKLPLLGVAYADMYRRTKVQEAIYEALTQQYELAKVQEAKEIPSVRVLDPAEAPRRRSSPKRLQILLAGVLGSLFVVIAWLLLRENWEQVDGKNSFKLLAHEVGGASLSRLRLASVAVRGKLRPRP